MLFRSGSLAMVGMPIFSGFISKLLFSQAAIGHTYKMLPTLIALAISTILNAIYFMKTVIRIYTPIGNDATQMYTAAGDAAAIEGSRQISVKEQPEKSVAMILFIAVNLFLGLSSTPVIRLIREGLGMFG